MDEKLKNSRMMWHFERGKNEDHIGMAQGKKGLL